MAQNYRRAKLRGKSFKGQDLTGADFSNSDIRGTDFSGAILTGANFRDAKAGLQRRWAIALVIFALLISAISGLLSAVGGSLLGFLLVNNHRENIYVVVISLVVLSAFFITIIRRGLSAACGFLVMMITWAGLAAIAWAGIIAVAWAGVAVTSAMELATLVAVIVTASVSVVIVAAGAVIIIGSAAFAGIIAGLLAVTVTVSVAGAIAGAVAVAAAMVNFPAGGVALLVAIAVVLLGAYASCHALFGDEKQRLTRNLAIALVAKYGTSFQGCDLTDADFTEARLKNTNFITAILTRTCWYQAKKLHLAAVGATYLDDLQLRELLVTKDLQNKNLNGWNLQNINLQAANIKDASLIGANLTASNLQDADFSRANLVQTQLDKSDLRGATLTGAYIKDWLITSETKLDKVKCEYIFMRIPTRENPNPFRLPTNWDETFKEDEFSSLFNPLSKIKI